MKLQSLRLKSAIPLNYFKIDYKSSVVVGVSVVVVGSSGVVVGSSRVVVGISGVRN